MTIQEIQDEIVEEFSFFNDWMDKYSQIIEYGKELEELDSKDMTQENLINGCQSKVWLAAEMKEEKIIFRASSDAIITKGIIALLLKVYSNRTPKQILETPPDFLEKIGLKENLSPTRANGLLSMIKQIKNYAIAFSQL